MTLIVLTICAAIAALIVGMAFKPDLASAIAHGTAKAFFSVLSAARQRRVKARREFLFGKETDEEPTPHRREPLRNLLRTIRNRRNDSTREEPR